LVDLAGLRRALTYQLKERLQFIREPEPIVAQLLVDLGDACLLSNTPGAAGVAYARAVDYGAASSVLASRIRVAENGAAVPPGIAGWLLRYWQVPGLAIVGLLAGFLVMRHRARLAAG
jgi:hypothetical protein